jgi:hypothetical protein
MDYRSPAAENHSRKGRTDRTTAVSLPGNYGSMQRGGNFRSEVPARGLAADIEWRASIRPI